MSSGLWRLRGAGHPQNGFVSGLAHCALILLLFSGSAAAATSGPNVVVTTKPIHSLVAGVMLGVGTPALLVDGSASPHTFSLKPSHVRAIDAADVFVRVSETLEPFTGKIARALPDSVQLVTLAEAPGVQLLDRRAGGDFEHEHHAGGEAHPALGSYDDEGGKDGHIWLDPQNAKAMVATIAQVLSERDPAHAAQFKVNATRLDSQLDALATEIGAATKPLQQKPFVVFHDAYQYFERRFGLDAVGSITVSPEVQPSAKRLSELRRKLRGLQAVCVFAEPLFQPSLVAAVTEGTDARSGTLDPEGVTLVPGPDLYAALMRNLATNLKACLAPAT